MAVKAYILMTVDTALTKEVLARLHDLSEPVEIHEVLGPYDVVVELEMERFEDVTAVLRQKIRPIPGVRNTVTCVDVQKEG